jgi:ATP-dependent Clp protease ATP-binding subunit ClpB
MTSNMGSQLILVAQLRSPFSDSVELAYGLKESIMRELQSHFRPEFLNRIDDIVFFDALSLNDIRKIVDIQLSSLRKRLLDRDMSLELTDEAKDLLAQRGYDPVFGARPLKRTLRSMLENPLAMALLKGEFKTGDTIVVDCDEADKTVLTMLKKQHTASMA